MGQVPSKLCVKNYKHLRCIKNIAALCLAETKGTDSSLEAGYGTGQGNIAGDTVPNSHSPWEEGLFEAVETGGWLDVFVSGAHSWRVVCLGRDSNEVIDYPVHNASFGLCPTPYREFHPRVCNMAVALQRRLKALQTNPAALLWTIYILLIDVMVCGSHI